MWLINYSWVEGDKYMAVAGHCVLRYKPRWDTVMQFYGRYKNYVDEYLWIVGLHDYRLAKWHTGLSLE
jgi:hypothetical protein